MEAVPTVEIGRFASATMTQTPQARQREHESDARDIMHDGQESEIAPTDGVRAYTD